MSYFFCRLKVSSMIQKFLTSDRCEKDMHASGHDVISMEEAYVDACRM